MRRGAARVAGAGSGLIGLVAAGWLLGCSEPETSTPGAAESATERAAEAAARNAGAPAPETLAPGSVLVSLSERGVTVRANQALRGKILSELERHAGFRLRFAPGTQLGDLVTLDAVDAPLEDVLGRLLEGWPYALYYGVAASGGRVLERVDVSEFPIAEAAQAGPAETSPLRSRRIRPQRKPDEERDPVADAERRARLEQLQDEFYDRIDDDDPAARAEAAASLVANERTVPALTQLLENDPDAGVRKAAASALSDADEEDGAALGALVGALHDADPQVVIAALDSIEWIADASVIPEITFLLDHANPEVVIATEQTIDYLQE